MLHYIEPYIAEAQHRITINLVGCGGTGSHVLTNLGMMNYSLIKLGRQPLFVRVWDPDAITEYNVGRQLFSPADIGRTKSEVLTERINRFYGTHWEFMSMRYEDNEEVRSRAGANFIISCVDSIASRKQIRKLFPKSINSTRYDVRDDYQVPYYWIDIGNGQSSGQILLSTFRPVRQPDDKTSYLPTFFDEFPKAKENNNAPNCSMAEALATQDLFINKIMATYATNMLWTLLTKFIIDYRGIYINLDDLKTSKIPISDELGSKKKKAKG